jgi:hypothetical protein
LRRGIEAAEVSPCKAPDPLLVDSAASSGLTRIRVLLEQYYLLANVQLLPKDVTIQPRRQLFGWPLIVHGELNEII